MKAQELLEIIKSIDYDKIHLLIMHPIDKDDVYCEVISQKSEKIVCKIIIKYENDKITILKCKNKSGFDEIEKNLGEFTLFNLIYFIALCSQLENCIV